MQPPRALTHAKIESPAHRAAVGGLSLVFSRPVSERASGLCLGKHVSLAAPVSHIIESTALKTIPQKMQPRLDIGLKGIYPLCCDSIARRPSFEIHPP